MENVYSVKVNGINVEGTEWVKYVKYKVPVKKVINSLVENQNIVPLDIIVNNVTASSISLPTAVFNNYITEKGEESIMDLKFPTDLVNSMFKRAVKSGSPVY